MKIKNFITICLLLVSVATFAQKKIEVTGVVTDTNKEPLVGVNVTVKDQAGLGAITDINGRYKISIEEFSRLVFSYIGFDKQEVLVKRQQVVNVIMKESEASELDEVVITGTGAQKKLTVTGAVTTVNVNDLKANPTANLSNALAGNVAGVLAMQTSGQPGKNTSEFWIRGISTFGADNSALVLVDGFERSLDEINIEDVESFTVLKDASTTAIYGPRGANGVVLITTKHGKEGKIKINAKVETSYNARTITPEFADGYSYAMLMNEARITRNQEPIYQNDELEILRLGLDPDLYPNVDWKDVLLKDGAMTYRANVNMNGGGSTARYFVSLSYISEEGMYKTDEAVRKDYNTNPGSQRWNYRLNTDIDITKTTLVKVGVSAVDIAGARKNVESEIPAWGFDKVRKDARTAWNQYLSKIDITTSDKEDKTIFYSALYHTGISPNLFTDADGRYLGMDLEVHQGDTVNPVYTVFSLWDTFRALHPLMTIIDPDLNNQFINSLIKKHQEGGIYPMWDLASNYTGTMIGYHAVPVIVDAYMKGYRNFDAKEAYKACLRAAEYDTTGIKCPDLVLPHLMPKAKYYKNAIGYIPCDRENESVAKALEYAYDDWCISIFAEAMNDFESKAKYERFAKAYEFYFDKSTRFMRGLDSKGEWRTPFNPRASTHRNDDYCEGTAWQWTWFVPHDVKGLVNLMGGEDAFVQKLDSLFTVDSSLEGETTSSDISGLIGQYAHGNEPSHHVIHLYNYVNRPWRTQELVDSVYRSQYANSIDGLSGNEDCGQMSAWYVLNSMGFYQVCPGKPVYSIGRPAFDKAVVNLPSGKKFSIVVKNNTKKNKYIESIMLNGKVLDTPFFNHQDIVSGGTIEIKMTNKPNY